MHLQLQEYMKLIEKMVEVEFLRVTRDFFEPSYTVRLELNDIEPPPEDTITEDEVGTNICDVLQRPF